MYRIIFLLLLIAQTAQAQYVSRLGRFKVDEVRGCVPFTITITNTNLTAATCPCNMDYLGNGNSQPNLLTFQYTTPGTYLLKVTYPNVGIDDITVIVDPNIQPLFDVYTCSGSQVSIKVTNKSYDSYAIDFGDGSPQVQIPSGNNQVVQYGYGSPGARNISVKGKKINAATNCTTKVQNFTAVAVLPLPQLSTLTAVDASTLKLDFVQQPNIQYKLEMAVNNGTFLQLQTLYGVGTVTVSSLNLDNNFYCFRLSSYDPCTFQNNYSEIICSHKMQLTILSNANRIDWQTNTAKILSTDLNRNGSLYGNKLGSPLTYPDPDVVCNTDYCYLLVSNYTWGGKSFSLQKCGKAFSSTIPAAILNASTVFDDTGLKISWQQDPLFKASEYTLFRSFQGKFDSYAKSTTTSYLDVSYVTGFSLCYKINYVDPCANTSPQSLPICPIELQGNINDENKVSLSWNAYSGWNMGVKNYVLEKFDKSGALVNTIDMGTSLTYAETAADLQNQIVSYKITAKPNEAGVTTSISNKITLTKNINLFYPTAFTPDGKPPVVNETFTVKGQFITKLELSVFDRWGTLIYYTDKNEPWDGNLAGQPMPISTYVWTANIIDMSGKSYHRSGTVVLMRK